MRLSSERMKEHDMVVKLFDMLMRRIKDAGYVSRKGQIVDASFVTAPQQRNTRDESKAIKEGNTPRGGKTSQMRLYGKKSGCTMDQ